MKTAYIIVFFIIICLTIFAYIKETNEFMDTFYYTDENNIENIIKNISVCLKHPQKDIYWRKSLLLSTIILFFICFILLDKIPEPRLLLICFIVIFIILYIFKNLLEVNQNNYFCNIIEQYLKKINKLSNGF